MKASSLCFGRPKDHYASVYGILNPPVTTVSKVYLSHNCFDVRCLMLLYLCIVFCLSSSFPPHHPRPPQAKKKEQTKKNKFDVFYSGLKGVLDKELEVGRYEEMCNDLLGAQSFPLMTLTRLMNKIVKLVSIFFSLSFSPFSPPFSELQNRQ